MFALVFEVLDLLIILFFDIAEVLEFVLIPFELLLQVYDTNILSQFLILFL